MDLNSARMSLTGSPPTPASAQCQDTYDPSFKQSTTQLSPQTGSSTDIFIDASPSRQQRLLHSRNARFPAKQLSISGLSNKLTQLIRNNEQQLEQDEPSRNQENKLPKRRSTETITKNSLGIVEDISHTTESRARKKRTDVSIYKDHPEGPLLQSPPLATSSPLISNLKQDFTCPAGFDHIQDSLGTMRLRELSLNERWSPRNKSATLLKAKSGKRSVRTQFDADEYIEHIEKELQQVRDEAYSPLTRRPMKEKLRAANKENERLHQELAVLRERFESEVKRTVEHKTATEVELRRRVRDLEDSLEEKEQLLRELQYQHEEKRLDSNIIETLKATIERLEQEKLDIEEINLSMSKRNEVLTQLLAMSPSKSAAAFNLGSPNREKRNARPLSLILPRHPSSPDASQQLNMSSFACSPLALNSANISPLKLSPGHEATQQPTTTGFLEHERQQPPNVDDEIQARALRSPLLNEHVGRRWTTLSDVSAPSGTAHDESRPQARRKARRFVAGSTQLKPLLLPALTGENGSVSTMSTASSPQCCRVRPANETDAEETVLPLEMEYVPMENAADDDFDTQSIASAVPSEGAPGPAYAKSELEADEERASVSLQFKESRIKEGVYGPASLFEQVTNFPTAMRQAEAHSFDPFCHHSCNSMHAMPVPSTPDSLAALPRPLFSPADVPFNFGAWGIESRLRSHSLSLSPEESIRLRKKREAPLVDSDRQLPPSKARRRHSSADHISSPCQPSDSPLVIQADPSIRPTYPQLRAMRSHDNFVEALRQKNFAVKPLAAVTIRTVYKIVASCTSTVRQLRREPFALARRILANVWYMHWRFLGKVSWWVLGLFIYPQSATIARPPIDWDQYDGESIASRYCNSDPSGDALNTTAPDVVTHYDHTNTQENAHDGSISDPEHKREQADKSGWARSLLLWGKFSAALLLAVGGAIVKGPGEMLKDVQPSGISRRSHHGACYSCGARPEFAQQHSRQSPSRSGHLKCQSQTEPTKHSLALELSETFMPDFEFRSETQLDSSDLLDEIQQPENGSTLRPHRSPRRRVASLFDRFSDAEPNVATTKPFYHRPSSSTNQTRCDVEGSREATILPGG